MLDTLGTLEACAPRDGTSASLAVRFFLVAAGLLGVHLWLHFTQFMLLQVRRELKRPRRCATLTRCAGHTCFLAAFARPRCGAAPNTRPAKSATATSRTSAEFVS